MSLATASPQVDQLVKFASNTMTGYTFFTMMWVSIIALANRVAIRKARAERASEENAAVARRDVLSRETRELEDRRVAQIEHRNMDLSSIAKTLRSLLKNSMTHNDQIEKWCSVLESSVLKHEPALLVQRPQFVPPPTADDVAAIYAEYGADSEGALP